MRQRIAALFARGIMFDPQSQTQRVVDTDQMDCTTPSGRERKRAFESVLFRRREPTA